MGLAGIYSLRRSNSRSPLDCAYTVCLYVASCDGSWWFLGSLGTRATLSGGWLAGIGALVGTGLARSGANSTGCDAVGVVGRIEPDQQRDCDAKSGTALQIITTNLLWGIILSAFNRNAARYGRLRAPDS